MNLSIENRKYLYDVCEEVEDIQACAQLYEGMVKILDNSKSPDGHRGVGLAANQVGDNRRCIMISTQHFRTFMINPEIKKRSKQTVMSEEGCLSFPGQQTTVPRSKQITVEWTTLQGKKKNQKFRGLESRVIQHEIDHLDGIVLFPEEEDNAD